MELPAKSPHHEYTEAIATLERLKATSTPGPWRKLVDEVNGVPFLAGTNDPPRPITKDVALIVYDIAECSATPDADLELIVTAHATIDEQLRLLREALQMEFALGGLAEFSSWQAIALGFARAINGASS